MKLTSLRNRVSFIGIQERQCYCCTPTKFPQNRKIEKKKQSSKNKKSNLKLRLLSAVRTRLELVTSCVTGRHSNQLN